MDGETHAKISQGNQKRIKVSKWVVDCPTQLTLYYLDLSVVFHDKYQWEI